MQLSRKPSSTPSVTVPRQTPHPLLTLPLPYLSLTTTLTPTSNTAIAESTSHFVSSDLTSVHRQFRAANAGKLQSSARTCEASATKTVDWTDTGGLARQGRKSRMRGRIVGCGKRWTPRPKGGAPSLLTPRQNRMSPELRTILGQCNDV
jgi:hypothetical protein